MDELKTYPIVEIPTDPRKLTIRMEKAELERFCKDQTLPLFSLKVEQTLLGPARIPSKVKNPHVKYFTLFQGIQVVAIEYPFEAQQEGARP